jgi:hypothetical protein
MLMCIRCGYLPLRIWCIGVIGRLVFLLLTKLTRLLRRLSIRLLLMLGLLSKSSLRLLVLWWILRRRLLWHLTLWRVIIHRRRRPRRLLGMWCSHRRIREFAGWWRRLLGLHGLDSLVALRIETRIYSRFRVSELLASALERSMLGLLPCRDVWRWRNVYTRHWICVRGHVRLYTLTGQGRWYICWLLLVRAHDGRLLRRHRWRRIAKRPYLICAIHRARPPTLRRWKV